MKENYLMQHLEDGHYNEMMEPGLTLLVAPTGTGKSVTINERFLKPQFENKNHGFGTSSKYQNIDELIGVFANRTAVKAKMEKDVEQVRQDMGLMSLDNVIVKSYQSMADEKNMSLLDNMKLILGDEFHYFISDAWNGQTRKLLRKLIKQSKTKPVILFTATPEYIIEYFNHRNIDFKIFDYTEKLGFYDRIDFVVTNKSLEQIVKEIPKDDKWLGFEEDKKSKKRQQSRGDALTEAGFPCTVYHSQWIKDKHGNFKHETDPIMVKRLSELILLKRFPTQGALANKALDNGIDIIDNNLKHIILINQFDPVQIKQMIGRKRFDVNNPNDRLTVYFTTDGKDSLMKFFEDIRERVAIFGKYMNFCYENENVAQKRKMLEMALYTVDNVEELEEKIQLEIYTEFISQNPDIITEMEDVEYSRADLQNEDYGGLIRFQYQNLRHLADENLYQAEKKKRNGAVELIIKPNIILNYQNFIKRLFDKSAEIQWRNKDQVHEAEELEFQRRSNEELVPYLEELFNEYEYLADDDLIKFKAEISFYYGVQKKNFSSYASVGNVNKFIKPFGFEIKNKIKSINKVQKAVWIITKM